MPPKFRRNLSQEDLTTADDVEKEGLLAGDDEHHASPADQEDEDFFLKGPSPKVKSVHFEEDDKVKQVRVQIREVTDVMRDNVGRLLERGDRLDSLHDRSELLNDASSQFRSASFRVSKKMWWREMRTRIILIAVVVIVLVIIFVPIIMQFYG